MWEKISTIYESRSRSLASLYSFRDAGDAAEVVTPFLDPNNERISLFIHERGDQYVICDHGLAARIVEMANRRDGSCILAGTQRDFGLSQMNDQLYIVSSEADLLAKQFRLCNALVALRDRLCTEPLR